MKEINKVLEPAKILIVDDDLFNQELLSEILGDNNYDFQYSSNGKDALNQVENYAPDLILMDVLMPEVNGFEVTKKIKQDKKFESIPIILQSGLDDKVSVLKGLEFGAEDYVTKPVEPKELQIRVRNLLRLKRLNDILLHNNKVLSDYDNLTGFFNYSCFLRKSIEDSQQHRGSFCILLVKIHNFSGFSSLNGQKISRLILKEFAKRLLQLEFISCIYGRLEKNKFAVYFRGGELRALSFTKEIQSVLNRPFFIDNREVFVRTCIGIVVTTTLVKEFESEISKAELALKKAKSYGANKYVFYTAGLDKIFQKKISLEQDLMRALPANEFELYFQPQIDLFTGRIKGAEALIRWNHVKNGIISPIQFIPLAEENGLIIDITRWVLREACRVAKSWQLQGHENLSIAVNISSNHFEGGKIVIDIAQALEKSKLNPKYLEVEITEGVMLGNSKKVLTILNKLKQLGVSISVDDFGTGYSSLEYLQKLPADRIKIDKSFVKDMTSQSGNAVITRSIISMSHEFGFLVLAEGVEKDSQLSSLINYECDEFQGYFFSKPVSEREFSLLLNKGSHINISNYKKNVFSRNLLIIDDESNIVRSLRRLMRRQGYKVYVALDALEAFDLLAKNKINVVISDYKMNGISGTEFFKQVKVMYPDIIRILLTGSSSLKSAVEAVNSGAVYKFFTKPWDDEELKDSIRNAFNYYEKHNIVGC